MTAELLARIGGPVAAGGLALVVLAPPRAARLAGLVLAAAGIALFLPLLTPSGHNALLAGSAILGLGLAAALAFVFLRWPWAVAFLALAAVPARLPVTVGDVSANLLVPLYVVLAGAMLALAWSLWRDGERRRELGALSWPLAILVLWVGLSIVWTNDPTEGAVELSFFLLPFGLLAVALARLPWSERALSWLFRLLVAMALVFAAVGIWQWLTRDVFWNPKVIAGNAYAPFYRVNSVFWDPSIYGRFLVVAILAALVLVLTGVRRRLDVPLTLLIAALWVGLLFSFSQSSFTALVSGVVVAAALAWRSRAGVAVGAAAAVMLLVGVSSAELPRASSQVAASSAVGLNRATSDRFDLFWNGVRIAAEHPLAGVGVGGFQRAYLEGAGATSDIENPASHNTPVTMAAENGFVGLALYVWLVAAAWVVALRRTRFATEFVRLAGLLVGVAFTAVFVHSLFYNAFFEDPMVWGFFAFAALAARESG